MEMMKKAAAVAIWALAIYGGFQAFKDGKAYLAKRKATAVPPVKTV
jgi:hypothetical protein